MRPGFIYNGHASTLLADMASVVKDIDMDMIFFSKLGYNVISYISKVAQILYHIIYPSFGYYIRYDMKKI